MFSERVYLLAYYFHHYFHNAKVMYSYVACCHHSGHTKCDLFCVICCLICYVVTVSFFTAGCIKLPLGDNKDTLNLR